MGEHQAVKLLFDEFRGLAAQDDLAASQVCFEFIKHAFDFPALGIEGREIPLREPLWIPEVS